MKKTIVYIITIIVIILMIIISKFMEYTNEKKQIDQFNFKYLQYTERSIKGINIASIINQAVDDNEKSYVEKDENGKYIQNEQNSVYIEVKITEFDEEQIYPMELLYRRRNERIC